VNVERSSVTLHSDSTHRTCGVLHDLSYSVSLIDIVCYRPECVACVCPFSFVALFALSLLLGSVGLFCRREEF